jgi:hypothetical protein
MNRIRLLAALAGALLAGLTVSTIAAARDFDGDNGGAPRGYVFGVGTYGPACWQTDGGPFCTPFSYTSRLLAVQQGNGRAWGLFERRNNVNSNTFAGRVTCTTIDGNRAVIGGMLTRQPGSAGPVDTPFVIYVEDNGAPGSSMPDQISALAIFPAGDPGLADMPARFPAVCPTARSIYGYAPLTSGDITVSESSVGIGRDD